MYFLLPLSLYVFSGIRPRPISLLLLPYIGFLISTSVVPGFLSTPIQSLFVWLLILGLVQPLKLPPLAHRLALMTQPHA